MPAVMCAAKDSPRAPGRFRLLIRSELDGTDWSGSRSSDLLTSLHWHICGLAARLSTCLETNLEVDSGPLTWVSAAAQQCQARPEVLDSESMSFRDVKTPRS